MLFHEAFARTLADQGINTIFGVLGDGNLHMMESFQRSVGGNYIAVAHECGAVLAANGYACTTSELGVAAVTHGPGLSNTVTALIESVKGGVPILLIAGDTPRHDRENFQNVSQREIVQATGAGYEAVRSPETVIQDISTAVWRALHERRPVVLNVPVEYQWAEVEYHPTKPRHLVPQAVQPDPSALDHAVGVIATARRPLILAGRGASSPSARAALARLAQQIGAPLATSLGAKDLFHGEPHNLGICGTLASQLTIETIGQSDCVIAFGASLNKWTTAEGSLLAGKAVIQVDVDHNSINKWAQASVGVIGDAAVVADMICQWLEQADIESTGFASTELAERLAVSRSALDEASVEDRSTETVDFRAALRTIDAAFPEQRTLVIDGGRFIYDSFVMLHAPSPQAYVHTLNFGSIGLGMGNAIGAAFGAPERRVLLVCGDGGFMNGCLSEFNTAVRHGLDIVVVVLNDGSYGAEYIQFQNTNKDPSISTFTWPEFASVALGLGGQGVTVHSLDQLRETLADLPRGDKPTLVDIKLDPDKIPAPGH